MMTGWLETISTGTARRATAQTPGLSMPKPQVMRSTFSTALPIVIRFATWDALVAKARSCFGENQAVSSSNS
jgi:hypothetical protein